MSDIITIDWNFLNWSVNLKHSLLIIAAIGLFSFILGNRVSRLKPTDSPALIENIVIVAISSINNLIKDYYGKRWRTFAPLLFAILFYLLIANTANLFGLSTPLSNINVALSFSIFAIFTIQGAGLIIKKPWQRLKDLSNPNVFLLPINLFGELSTPTAMGLRLFGNILSGAVISALIYAFFGPSILGTGGNIVLTTVLLHPVFTVFFGAIQAFVYFMLLTIFLSMAIEDSEPA